MPSHISLSHGMFALETENTLVSDVNLYLVRCAGQDYRYDSPVSQNHCLFLVIDSVQDRITLFVPWCNRCRDSS